ncbi:MAG: ketosteroid isomerase family protein [Mycobacterium sp.]
MAAVDGELLAAVERSPAATDAHNRPGWVGLFTADARVEDPYGSRPHVGLDAIGRFYDTFIGPRDIIFHRDVDVAVGHSVVRDLTLEIVMADGVSLDVPMHLRYDLAATDGDWKIERLRAHWELPTMVAQMLRHGAKSLPVSLRLSRALLRNQGLGGTVGFVSGFRRPGKREKRHVEEFLAAATGGDEVTVRRALSRAAVVNVGDETALAPSELVDRLRGGRWSKVIAAGDTVSASLDTPSGHGVVFCEMGGPAAGLSRVRFFG